MILVISNSQKNAEKYSELFNVAGYLSYGTSTSFALNEISTLYRAVLIINPAAIAGFDNFLYHFSAPRLGIPIFSLGEYEDKRISENIPLTSTINGILKRIIRFSVVNEKPIIGKYKCAGFDCSSSLANIEYFSKTIKLTKTEKMIFRYLNRTYPVPQTAKSIMKYAIRPSRSLEPSCIRAHVSLINKKFREQLGRPVIEFYDNRGYIIITPELKNQILK